jgi:hypothetical protein
VDHRWILSTRDVLYEENGRDYRPWINFHPYLHFYFDLQPSIFSRSARPVPSQSCLPIRSLELNLPRAPAIHHSQQQCTCAATLLCVSRCSWFDVFAEVMLIGEREEEKTLEPFGSEFAFEKCLSGLNERIAGGCIMGIL